jgi:hypothetical protein
MALAASLTATAKDLLTRYGEQVTVVRDQSGSYDVQLASVVFNGVVSFNAFGVPTRYTESEIDNEMIRRSDTRFIMEKPDLEPEVNDKIDLNNQTHRVLDVQRIRLSGQNIIYILQLRA